MNEREVEAVLLLQATGGRELRLRVIDSNYACAAPIHPGADIGRSAAELDRILPAKSCGNMRTSDSGTCHMPHAGAC